MTRDWREKARQQRKKRENQPAAALAREAAEGAEKERVGRFVPSRAQQEAVVRLARAGVRVLQELSTIATDKAVIPSVRAEVLLPENPGNRP